MAAKRKREKNDQWVALGSLLLDGAAGGAKIKYHEGRWWPVVL